MRTLDDTDRDILRLLLDDARRPYSDIAEQVGLSAPAVSDRVTRLEDLGIIRSFTLELDRSQIEEGTPVLVELQVTPGTSDEIVEALTARPRVEHVFATADARVLARMTTQDGDVAETLAGVLELDQVQAVDVSLLRRSEWSPTLDEVDLALSCVECGNTVTSEGESAVIGGTRRHFCCGSCRANFENRYERLQSGA